MDKIECSEASFGATGISLAYTRTETQRSNSKRGAFIVFEGVDRCGKSTQSSRLFEVLVESGVQVQQMRFPDRSTTTGKLLNDYLQRRLELSDRAAVHSLFVLNRLEQRQKLIELLDSGVSVVCDRYSYSGVAYTLAQNAGDDQDVSREWCIMQETCLPAPDLVVYLSADAETLAKRGGYGEERYEVPELQRRVAEIFTSLQAEEWAAFNAAQPVEELATQISDRARSTIAACASLPVGRFVPVVQHGEMLLANSNYALPRD
ncbi:MAG: hypothetical protein MHM6MM_003746 [Cercozoa sp. M6MM]